MLGWVHVIETVRVVQDDWRVVAQSLERSCAGPSDKQVEVAAAVRTKVATWPRPVAAALLRRALGDELAIPTARIAADGEVEFCRLLAEETATDVPGSHLIRVDLTDAWVQVMFDRRAAASLRALKPQVGDIVERLAGAGVAVGEISSISLDGRLNFRGGRGRGVRPHQARIVARKSDDPAVWQQCRERAREEVARLERTPQRIGVRERAALDPHRVDAPVSEVAAAAFYDAVESAGDEKPLQQVLELFPGLLTHLVDHTQGAWVLPRPSLSGRYVPDFLVAAETSMGVNWLFVELESPTHRLLTQAGTYTRGVRNALTQVDDWRNWVRDNQSVARRPISEGGLGLAGVREDARGLVLIGRGELSGDPDLRRLTSADRDRTEIRTYDWLLRSVQRPRLAGLGVVRLSEDDE